MNVHREGSARNAGEEVASHPVPHPHRRLRTPHRTHSALRALRAELEALYAELTAALLPDAKGKK